MMQSTLTIRYCHTPQRKAVAWFVPGSGPEQWLTELSRWPLAMHQLTLRPLPAERHRGELAGVLVTTAGEPPSMALPGCSQYGVIAGRLYLPVEARLDPRALESEIVDLIAGNDDDYVFHPSIGLVRIEQRERLCASDLLQPPPCAATDWNCAQPGHAPLRPLTQVEPEAWLTPEEILLDAQDDIGTEDPENIRPDSSSAQQTGRSPAGSGAGGWLGNVVRRLFDRLRSETGSAKKAGRAKSRSAVGEGNQPVDRLLELLKENPDEGLRYAVPLEGAPGRGTAPAGTELARRNVDFNLRGLTASGPGGVWAVSHQRYESLRDKYRQLANRELSLGRHRRAAYIFAHLLGDMHNAAAALKSGGHWREAAVLYRDRLNLPQVAAECLEQGQLCTEAIEIYLQLESFEIARDLYRRIGQDEQAGDAYRRAMAKCLAAADYLETARLAEKKLNAPQEALYYLAQAWPNSDQAIACLNQMFTILAARGQHADAGKLVHNTDPCLLAVHKAKKAVNALADVATRYPDPQVRVLAADRVRVAAGHLLAQDAGGDVNDLVQDVRRLVPEDRLLERDCQRYQQMKRVATAANVRAGSSMRHRDVWQLVWSFNLPENVVWVSAAGSQDTAYVAGYEGPMLMLVRLPFSPSIAERTVVSWPVSPSLIGAPLLLCPDPQEQAPLIAQVVGAAGGTASPGFSATDASPARVAVAGSDCLTPNTRGVARSPDSITWVVDQVKDELVLRNYGPSGRLLGSQVVPLPPETAVGDVSTVEYVASAASLTHVYLAVADHVVCIRRGVRTDVMRMKSQVLEILLPPDDYPHCAIVRCQHEVVALWHDLAENRLELLDDTMTASACGCTRDGRLVLADGQRFSLYARRREHFELMVKGARSLNSPLAILPTRQPNQILILCRHGEVELLNLR